jgi:glutaconate CoA-transferase, subunit B
MIAAAARYVRNAEHAFAGLGLPLLAASVAKRVHAPNATLTMELGAIGFRIERMPFSICDSELSRHAGMVTGLIGVLGMVLQRGQIDVAMLPAAQIDQYGNVNSSFIGDCRRPRVRLPGSGGANDAASLAGRTVIIMEQDRRKFVDRVDFITSPGHLKGRESRRAAGLRGSGPQAVVTDMGVFEFDPIDREMYLRSVHPGVSIQAVLERTGFQVRVPASVHETPAPTDAELTAMRAIDPDGVFI